MSESAFFASSHRWMAALTDDQIREAFNLFDADGSGMPPLWASLLVFFWAFLTELF